MECAPSVNFLGQRFQKLQHEQDRQTDRQTDTHTHTHRQTQIDRQMQSNILRQPYLQVAIIVNLRQKLQNSSSPWNLAAWPKHHHITVYHISLYQH